jgi:dTDP-4-dehydrorhamnose reductase
MKIYIGGHKGLLGNAMFRELTKNKNYEIITRERSRLDLLENAHDLPIFFRRFHEAKEANLEEVVV